MTSLGKFGKLSKRKRGAIVGAAVAVATAVGGTLAARRMGYTVGRQTVVKCRAGHVFSTIWIPGASFKSLRLGFWRVQWCPVGKHVTLVHPVKNVDLTAEMRDLAADRHDVRIP
jgi:hypothetical protein